MNNDAAANRRAEFVGLVRDQEAALLRTARRLCRGDDDRAQDLVQDALIRAYEAYLNGKFRAGLNVRAWFLRILTNLYINDYHRRRKWEADIDIDTLTSAGEAGPDALHAKPADVPGETLMEATLDEPMERALAALSDSLRLCVLLVDVEGLDYAEAALALNVPIGTVRSRLSRARFQLHALLADYARDHGYLKSP